jgi:hypothetical protein
MIFYLLIFTFLSALALMSDAPISSNARFLIVLISYVAVVMVAGLRWETGNDWVPYYDYYQSLTQLDDKAADFEVGYRAISLALKDMSFSYSGFLLIYSGIYLWIMIFGFKEDNYGKTPWLILLLYSSFLLGWMGTARQAMAIALCLLAARCLIQRRILPFIILTVIATTFHTTAWCFFLAWPLAHLKLRRFQIWAILGTLILFAMMGGGQVMVRAAGNLLHIPYLDSKLVFYQAISDSDLQYAAGSLAFLWYAKRLAFLVFFTIFFDRFQSRSERIYFNLYLFSLILFLVFVGVIPMIPLRAGLYFSVFELFLLVGLIDKFRAPWARSCYKIAVVLIALSRLYSSVYLYHPDLFVPYKGLFINQEFMRAMY